MKQRGLTQVQMILAVVALGILAAMFFATKGYIDGVRQEGYDAGRKAALLEVAQRDNKQLAGALARVRELEGEKAQLERAHRERMAEIDKQREAEVSGVHEKKDRVIAELRAGIRRLRDAGRSPDASCPGSGGDQARGPADAAGERDASAKGGPAGQVDTADADAEFTVGLLAEGDEAIVDLTACQAILEDWGPRLGAKLR